MNEEKVYICNNCGESFQDSEAACAAEAECPYCYTMDCCELDADPDERLPF